MHNLILPLFVQEGEGEFTPIASMPGQARLSIDLMVKHCESVAEAGVPGIALFPALPDDQKDTHGTSSTDPDNVNLRAVRAIKAAVPDLMVITDVALDPYSSDGHDGVVIDGQIVNDESVEILAAMAVAQAEAGTDVVAPSDMMDGRIGAIRQALDAGRASRTCSSIATAQSTRAPFTARSARRSTASRAAATRRPIRWTQPTGAKRIAGAATRRDGRR